MENNKFRLALKNNKTGAIQLLKSSFDRQVGDRMVIENENCTVVATFANVAEQNYYVRGVNYLVSIQNKANRKQQRIEEAKFWVTVMKENPSLLALLKEVAEIKRLENQLK